MPKSMMSDEGVFISGETFRIVPGNWLRTSTGKWQLARSGSSGRQMWIEVAEVVEREGCER